MIVIGFAIDEDQNEALEYLAALQRKSKSAVIRDALGSAIDFEKVIPQAKNFFVQHGEALTTPESPNHNGGNG